MRAAIGVDFGTESGRALLLNLETGEELAVSVVPYSSTSIHRRSPASPQGSTSADGTDSPRHDLTG